MKRVWVLISLLSCMGVSLIHVTKQIAYSQDAIEANWKFNDLFVEAAEDSTYNNHLALIYGAAKVEGVVDQGLKFDGISNFARTLSAEDFNFGVGDFSITFWVKTSSQNGNVIHLREDLDPEVANYQVWITTLPDRTIGVGTYANGDQANIASSGIVADGFWHHIAVVRDGNTHSIYIDGSLDNSLDGPVIDLQTKAIYFGAKYGDKLESYLNGIIDGVYVYRRALSAVEVNTIYLSVND